MTDLGTTIIDLESFLHLQVRESGSVAVAEATLLKVTCYVLLALRKESRDLAYSLAQLQ